MEKIFGTDELYPSVPQILSTIVFLVSIGLSRVIDREVILANENRDCEDVI